VKAEAGTLGMDPSIFKPLQNRDGSSTNVAPLLGSLTSVDSNLRKRQQEVDSILEALAQNNPEDAVAAKQSLSKRMDNAATSTRDNAAFEDDENELEKRNVGDLRKVQMTKVVRRQGSCSSHCCSITSVCDQCAPNPKLIPSSEQSHGNDDNDQKCFCCKYNPSSRERKILTI
jgi:hypothetical protein